MLSRNVGNYPLIKATQFSRKFEDVNYAARKVRNVYLKLYDSNISQLEC